MLKSTLIKAAVAGANQLKHFFNGEFKISNKEGMNNLVTEADHAAEKHRISFVMNGPNSAVPATHTV